MICPNDAEQPAAERRGKTKLHCLTRIAQIYANGRRVGFHSRQFAKFASRSDFVPVLFASICVHLRFQ